MQTNNISIEAINSPLDLINYNNNQLNIPQTEGLFTGFSALAVKLTLAAIRSLAKGHRMPNGTLLSNPYCEKLYVQQYEFVDTISELIQEVSNSICLSNYKDNAKTSPKNWIICSNMILAYQPGTNYILIEDILQASYYTADEKSEVIADLKNEFVFNVFKRITKTINSYLYQERKYDTTSPLFVAQELANDINDLEKTYDDVIWNRTGALSCNNNIDIISQQMLDDIIADIPSVIKDVQASCGDISVVYVKCKMQGLNLQQIEHLHGISRQRLRTAEKKVRRHLIEYAARCSEQTLKRAFQRDEKGFNTVMDYKRTHAKELLEWF